MDCEKIQIPYRWIKLILISFFLPTLLVVNKGFIVSGILFGLLLFLITSNRPYWIYVILKTFIRDFRLINYFIKTAFKLKRFANIDMTVTKKFFELTQKFPDKVVLYTEEGRWTYLELYNFANKMGHVLKDVGVKRNDTVGVFFGDGGGAKQPSIWFGSSYLGVPVAILPPQLKSTSLIHCVKAAKVTHLIFSQDLAEVIREIQNNDEVKNIHFMQYNTERDAPLLNGVTCIATKLKNASSAPFIGEINTISYTDVFIYIFTSGTTGLPKATVISHMRYLLMVTVFNGILNKNDTIYVPLPLHHAAGCVLGMGQGLIYGIPVVLRKKFSVTNFWKDCIKYNCTVAQYIGETCRFLLNFAKKTEGNNLIGPHSIRLMFGNGLRPSIWEDFQKTFKIPKICEFYGSTEGNATVFNIESKKKAIGYIPRWLYKPLGIKLIKCDQLTGEPIRDENGFCILCKPCEAGLVIGQLDFKKKLYSFTGYLDQEASKKKFLYNVLKKGDVYFNSGDILVMDDLGYLYFKDRTGDTFRWRGENVSSTEVENIITDITKLDAVVYGVEIPNIEGRAGMAAIQDNYNKLDLESLPKKLKSILPSHAHPIFIRIIDNVALTTTFKLIKTDFQKEAYNINKTNDKIYFFDQMSSNYVPLSKLLYQEIVDGKLRL